ncbi:MAG: shikimate kinase [Bacilli bacterium]|nr:shikimate kinase [Bacilli bacterium]
MKYGLIGENISYSLSKRIHQLFGNEDYTICSINSVQMDELLSSKSFKGVNVTIPYKEAVIRYLDEMDESVRKIGSCNLIINKNGKLVGYNTDYFGFLELIKHSKMNLQGSNVVILGSGGTSKTVKACLKSLYVRNIYVVSRSNKPYGYDDLCHLSYDYLINTTPVGSMNNDHLVTHLNENIKGVIDVIYRPFRTKLLLEAIDKNVPHINGLYMLVYQAYLTHLKFFNQTFNESEVKVVYKTISKESQNIVLIGMSRNGKTTIGRLLANKMNRQFIDVDEEIKKQEKKDIPSIFKDDGEQYFRKVESQIIEKIKYVSNSVIVLGGGAILNKINIDNMRQNGIIYNIIRDINLITFDDSRPLNKNKSMYQSLLLNREKLYNKYSSKSFYNNKDLDSLVNEMESDFNENFSR